eukprot:m.458153 g.458153  ORF g.458153 m.458153 type:complete len:433 (-) comp21434_c0_seq1:2111-3409(-)
MSAAAAGARGACGSDGNADAADGRSLQYENTTPTRKENPNGFRGGVGKRYDHIENLSTAAAKGDKMMRPYLGATVALLPKLDGTHCSFEWPPRDVDAAAGLGVSPCKRTGFIGDATGLHPGSEKFFCPGFPSMIKDVQGAVVALCQELKEATPSIEAIRVHGEVVGGHYPHPDVPRNRDYIHINLKVAYAPDHRFVAYDIECTQRVGSKKKGVWLPHREMLAICAKHGIRALTPVLTGVFEEVLGATFTMLAAGETPTFHEATAETGFKCPVNPAGDLGLSPIFRPMVPTEYFGLPPIEQHDEGWVIKLVANPNGQEVTKRECIKFKHPDREEVRPPPKLQRPKEQLSGLQREGFDLAQGYITDERLDHVLDKVGDADRSNASKIRGMYIEDVFAEFSRATDGKYGTGLKAIRKELIPMISAFISQKLPQPQ